MTHITRVFNPETRSLTSVERRYAGQTGDALSTVLHFEYTELDFLMKYTPYIMFSTLDDDGNPMIYGPAMPEWSNNENKVPFDGVSFAIPWEVPVRAKSARIDYQLFFVKKGVNFDGRNVAKLNPTEVVMSAVDSIAIKPSIACKGNRNPCKCPPFSPTGTEPNVIGYINLWKDYGIVVPASQMVDEENRVAIIKLRTYNGTNDQDLYLDGMPILIDGVVPIDQLPVGHTADKIPLLKGTIDNGQSVMYDEVAGGFVAYDITGVYQFRGTCTGLELNEMEKTMTSLSGEPLANGDVYSCTSPRIYGVDEFGRPEVYKEGTNWVWSEQNRFEPLTGELDLSRYQLESAKIDEWDSLSDDPVDVSEKLYPTARLVKASLDDKLDDSQLIHSWSEYDASKTGVNAQIPSVRLTKATLDDKLDDMQVIRAWEILDPSLIGQDIQIPSAALTKASLDDKLDDSQVLTDWNGYDPSLVGQDIQVPSTKLMSDRLDLKVDDTQIVQALTRTATDIPSTKLLGEQLDLKTDKTMAIPNWSSTDTYNLNSTVMYNGTIFVSLIDGNRGIVPVDDEGSLSENWSMVQGGGGGSEATAQRWVLNGTGSTRSFTIIHNFGVKDLFVAVREKSSNRFVSVPVTVVRPGAVRLDFYEPPAKGESYYVSISPAVPTVPQDGEIYEYEFLTETTTWTINHNFHRTVIVQTYNQNGVEVVGSVKQSADLDTTVVEFNHPTRGWAVVR